LERFKQKITQYHVVLCGHCILEDGLRRRLRESGVCKPDVTRVPAGAGSLASIPVPCFAETILEASAKYIAMHQVEAICFFNHQQCGAYTHEGHCFPIDRLTIKEHDFHLHELKIAEKRLREFLDSRGFPNIRLHGGFIWIDPTDVLHIDWLVPPPNPKQFSFCDDHNSTIKLIAS